MRPGIKTIIPFMTGTDAMRGVMTFISNIFIASSFSSAILFAWEAPGVLYI